MRCRFDQTGPSLGARASILCLAILGMAFALHAQEVEPAGAETPLPDPTRASARMNDVLKEQLAGLRTVALKGAVIARGGGVALLEMQDNGLVVVRSNSQFTATVAGVPLKVVVKAVTPAGVEIEAPTLSETLLLPSTLGPSPAGAAASPLAMRHVEFFDVPLGEALRMLSEQSGTNYSASAEAGKVPVSIFLRNVPARVVVEEICKSHNLWFKQDAQTGVLRITTMQEFESDLVSFREEQSDVFTLLYPNALEVASVIYSLYGDRVVLSLGHEEVTDESRDLARRFLRFDMVNQRAGGTFSGSGSAGGYGGYGESAGYGGASAYGGGTAVLSGSGGTVWTSDRGLVQTSSGMADRDGFRRLTPEQAQDVQRLLQTPRTATNDQETALQPYRQNPASIYVTVSRRNNMIIVRTSDPRVMEDIRSLVRRLDVPTSLVLLEVKILSVDLSNGFSSVFDYQFNAMVSGNNGDSLTSGGFTSGEILPPAPGSMTPGGSGVRSGDMTFQIVNEYFRARMQLLEEKNRVTNLATPLLLTANNEVSRLFIGEERPLVRNISSQTILTDNNVATAPNTTVEFRQVGITLLITPNINSDRTVTLRLVQENSAINPGSATIPVVVADGAVQNVSIDTVSSRVISGTFAAKDGMAVAVGGLIEEEKADQRAQVPLLGRIPLLGFFFRRQATTTTRRELVMLIRPHVISTPAEGEAISRDLLKGLSVHPALLDESGTLNTFTERDRGDAETVSK